MKECYVCGAKEDLQEHHIIPRSKGGENTKTITLCYSCHCKSHGRDSKGLDHSRLVSEGIKKKIAEKGHWGNTKGIGLDKARQARINKANAFAERYGGRIAMLSRHGCSNKSIAKFLNNIGYPTPSGRGRWSTSSVKRAIERWKKIKMEDK